MNYLKKLKKNEEFEYWQGASKEEISFVEKELGVCLTDEYSKFLSECGMCNFGDINILGIAKDEESVSYPIIDLTIQMREELNIPNNFIVLSYEVGEYLTVYKVSERKNFKDSKVLGADVEYDSNQNLRLGDFEELFESFQDYFEDFIELAEE